MKPLFSLPIRAQLLLITLMIAIPAIAIIIFTGMQLRERAVNEAYALTRLTAERVASEQKDTASDIEQLLVTLAQMPDVRMQNKARVQPLLLQLKALNPEYLNILVADQRGKTWAAVSMPPPPSLLNDRRYFKNAIATGRISSGEYVISKSLATPVFHFAYPYRDQSGKINGAIVVALSLEKYLATPKNSRFYEDSNILLLDHNGIILSRAVEPEKVIGKKYPEKPLLEMFAGPEEYSYKGVGSLNDERFISYRKIWLEGEATPYMYVRVGVPVKTAMANANRFMAKSVAILSAFLFGTLLLAYLIGKRSIADRISLLQHASNRIADGDRQVRVSDSVVGGELGSLAQSFDSMASKLAERERAIRESEERFKALSEASFGGIIIHDKGLILECNVGLSDLTGFSYEELIGMNGLELIAPESLDTVLANIRSGYDQRYEVTGLKTDGSRYPLAIKGKNVTYKGRDVRVIEFRDITERKWLENEKHLLEKQFQQTQKLESLGVLAGGIAHDFNNILAIIVGYCGLTKKNYENAEKHIPKIEQAAERAAALCSQMLAYAGKASLTQSQVNTWMLVDEMVTMLKTTLQQNIVIKLELGTDIPFIMGDASQLRQVVMNLIINAAEAIGDAEGEIYVKLAKTEISVELPEKDHLGFIIPAGRYICFEVSDNGCGMDDDTRHKIFEPFYTTKFTGRGLGMSAVLGIIKAHNGALQLESLPGHGTTFRVYLPAQLSILETEETPQTKDAAPWLGSGTILLAEDEEQVKLIATIMLKEMGFHVLDAANGKEALELYLQNAADITLVVTDMGMPVMNGYDLFYKLKQLNPQLPIIISSGFGEGDIVSKIPSEEIAGMLNKPYRFEQLREVLRCVVEEAKSANA
ncbi:MAG: response regulator [Geobacteraceae bacterium]|nr:response regulator [Geobacteraceae bacterium]NTW79878.1 response regulator [Geobacteraceae bacterium]